MAGYKAGMLCVHILPWWQTYSHVARCTRIWTLFYRK